MNDDLFEFISKMKMMFQGMSAGINEFDDLFQTVQEDLRLVLTTHSNYSLGRLHQTFIQFLEMTTGVASSFMKIPQNFIESVEKFIYYKISASPIQKLFEEISKLVSILLLFIDNIFYSNFVVLCWMLL